MTPAEHKETDARVNKAWSEGFHFGIWLTAILTGVGAGVLWAIGWVVMR